MRKADFESVVDDYKRETDSLIAKSAKEKADAFSQISHLKTLPKPLAIKLIDGIKKRAVANLKETKENHNSISQNYAQQLDELSTSLNDEISRSLLLRAKRLAQRAHERRLFAPRLIPTTCTSPAHSVVQLREALTEHLKPNESGDQSLAASIWMEDPHWFDFRRLPIPSAIDEMSASGKKLHRLGYIASPFPTSVFVFACQTSDGMEVDVLLHVTEVFRGCVTVRLACLGSDGSYSFRECLGHVFLASLAFYYIAVLSSKDITARPIGMPRSASAAAAEAACHDGYTIVDLSLRVGSQNLSDCAGSHRSPRLHWRRGHTRCVGSKVILVRPALVGSATAGTISHSYMATGAGL